MAHKEKRKNPARGQRMATNKKTSHNRGGASSTVTSHLGPNPMVNPNKVKR